MSLVILNIVAIICLLVLSVLLLIVNPHNNAKRLLAAIVPGPIFSIAVILTIYYNETTNYPMLFCIAYLYDFLWPPLFYFFCLSQLHQEVKFTVKSIRYFSFFIAACTYFIWFALQSKTYRVNLLEQTFSKNPHSKNVALR